MTAISVIIPCYNDGEYITEAIRSVEQYPDSNKYEIIILNDGSTETKTCELLTSLSRDGYHVINQPNKGLGAARNRAIAEAKNEYILPLDSDNKIRPDYIQYGIEILDRYPDVGVVYGDAAFFGDKNTIHYVPEMDIVNLLHRNTIDACAVYRKAIWNAVGGYDENMPVMGYEDWEFWIRVIKAGWKFKHVNQVLFDYRVRNNSMISFTNQYENQRKVRHYMVKKHTDLYCSFDSYIKLLDEYLFALGVISTMDGKLQRCENRYRSLRKETWALLILFVKNIVKKIIGKKESVTNPHSKS
jgi:glycosyltransferase involved in cell wall biosynthesis